MHAIELQIKKVTTKWRRSAVQRIATTIVTAMLGLGFPSLVAAANDLRGSGESSRTEIAGATPDSIFPGSTGTVGMEAHHGDTLVFADGQFHSRECAKLGFGKTQFTVESDGKDMHFSAVSVSERYGTLSWKGVIRGDKVEARYVWKKERLFWTLEREYWFKGHARHAHE